MRLDQYMVQAGLAESRERAKQAIKAGAVKINGQPVVRPAQVVDPSDTIVLEEATVLRFVSAGGHKLQLAIDTFSLDFRGAVVLDVGASTGGFTDCALQAGAASIYAVDVGESQLHPMLQQHPLVMSMEKQDIRKLAPAQLAKGLADIVVIDVSFISLRHILPFLQPLMKASARVIALVKPQFELEGRRFANGIVKDEKLRQLALQKVGEYAAAANLVWLDVVATPADGLRKNIEYLVHLRPQGAAAD
jgi:23S rRNA (cytidine1920-2'-O)/16S rRNA (cytidine1409-2'-O)-methyltransferase